MKKLFFVLAVLTAGKLFAQNTFPENGSVGINKTTSLRSELDVNGRVSSNADFYTSVMFPANFAVGDYIEFVKTIPDMAGSSGNYEISIAYTRGNIAAAATFLASVSHSNPAIWREAGKINSSPYVEVVREDFTIDCNTAYGNARFRIRAINTYGSQTEPMYVTIKVRSINANLGWEALNVTGNDVTPIKRLPMTNEWNLYVGNVSQSDDANIALKAISNGNIGIGTPSPQYKLQVHSDTHATLGIGSLTNANTGNIVFYEQDPAMQKVELSYWGQATNGYSLTNKFAFISHNQNATPYTGYEFGRYSATDGYSALMTLNTNDGKVGIGTINPKEKLSVNGTVLAKKVRVSQSAIDWPDYVFDKSYQLASLDSVETFINDNKHLPGIPSAAAVEKDGHDLGEMQKLMLQKIEELTLYVIELKKENVEIKKQLKKQKK